MNTSKMFLSLILLAVISGCGVGKKKTTTEVITVDVNENYPKKELILQDFMDVEYIPLETTDEFITKGFVKAVGSEFIVATNLGTDGDIFIFDRSGKGVRKINRFGQGGEEYASISTVLLDDDQQELFVQDYAARKVLVYDLYGNFKRSFKYHDTSYYENMYLFDRENLICYKGYSPTAEGEQQSSHIIISKQDGSITREIILPFKEARTPVIIEGEMVITPPFHQITTSQENWILSRTSSDTIYSLLPDGSLTPLIIRTPSIQSMEKETFLYLSTIADRYYFMHTQKKEVDFKTFKGFPGRNLIYDKQEKAIFEYTAYNDDYSNKKEVWFREEAVGKDVAFLMKLEAFNLIESYEKGELKGKLKEIAATLDEESNPVIMLIKHKK